MITRIVRMTFRKDKVADFKAIFAEVHEKINSQPGCLGVVLLNDIHDEKVFFTYSRWADETALEAYRKSTLFHDTWSRTKQLFEKRPEAWTLGEQECATGR